MKIDDYLEGVISNPGSAVFYTPSIYEDGLVYLFGPQPVATLTAKKSNLLEVLGEVDEYIGKGFSGFGLLFYEAGYLLEKKLNNLYESDEALLKFYFFKKDKVQVVSSDKIEFSFNNELDGYRVENFSLNTSDDEFFDSIRKIKTYIEEGDTYQVNYTIKGKFRFVGNAVSLFKQMVFNQSAKYSAFINTGDSYILSLSPELFFSAKEKIITTRPMKGTSTKGINSVSDSISTYSLRNSEKNRAENLMILDLLRNDMGRISEFGTVRLRKLFFVERYETILQMVSEVESVLKDKVGFSEIIKNIFPCGSVSGAPKIRTMEIIKQIEKEDRGIYTGTIGLFHENNKIFNVAIRTVTLKKQKIGNGMDGEIGIGSGIVWDSDPEKEYDEVLLKSKFLTKPNPYFEIFETLKYSNGMLERLNLHLDRMRDAASFFLFKFDEGYIFETLRKQISTLDKGKEFRVKIILDKWGNVKVEVSDIQIELEEIKIIISSKTISTKNRFQYFKTTNRALYDREHEKYHKKGFFDTVFINEKQQVAEGARTNIFINKNGLLYTPPLSTGILPGIFRKHWLQTNINIKEEVLYKDDLLIADEIILTNSIRGKVSVDKLFLNETEFIEYNKKQGSTWFF
jgi:para-aminobenzoate synthetase/4-amino-4-deoxychorismate lyase